MISPGEPEQLPQSLTVLASDAVALLPLAGMVDVEAERQRLTRELDEVRAERDRATAQLANESFVSRAPEKVVEVQRNRLARANEQIAVLEARLAELGG